jgi:hypothetical protein
MCSKERVPLLRASMHRTSVTTCLHTSPRSNAKVVKEELGEGESGYTLTKPNGKHVITVNSLESDERQRFTICHEVAHIALNLPSSHDEVPSWSYAKRHPNEVACDTFAAELLMPYQQWLDCRSTRRAVSQLSSSTWLPRFAHPFTAAASRFACLTDLCPVLSSPWTRGTVRYAARSMSLRRANAWIPPRSPIPQGSVSHRLRAAEVSAMDTADVAQDIWFENWGNGFDLWELAKHYRRSDTTIALLWFDHEDLPEAEVSRFGVRVEDDGGLAELTGELPWPGRSKRR